MAKPSVENLHERSDGRTLLALKVALVAVVVVTLSAAGLRGVTHANGRTEQASGPQPVLTSLSVVGELPEACLLYTSPSPRDS